MTPVEDALRRAILAAADSEVLERTASRFGMRLGAARFVAGQTLDECVAVLRRLESEGFKTNTTLLGEAVGDAEGAASAVRSYEEILDRIQKEGLGTNVALKLTHLGLGLGEEVAAANLERVVEAARERSNVVRIDMESSSTVDATLRIYRGLRDRGYENLGVVLQSYLYRSECDLRALLPLRPNVRIVKGAYLEPPSVAYPRKQDVDTAYVDLLELALREAGYTAVATHDERLIEHAIAFAERERIARDRFEFQMLYGVRRELQQRLLRRGFTVLVATPFGPDWFPFFMRRLAERPANLGFVASNLLRR